MTVLGFQPGRSSGIIDDSLEGRVASLERYLLKSLLLASSIEWGLVSLEWPGGSAESNPTVVTTKFLTVIESFVPVGAPNGNINVGIQVEGTKVNVRGRTVNAELIPAKTLLGCYYIAIGK
jgi:hypothetical protein